MKKKNLTGKLSLEKSRISALDSAKIKGGSISMFCIPKSLREGGCILTNNGCNTPSQNPGGSNCACE